MDKIRIVVEYNELSESKKADYLKENGIDKKTIEAYQKEAASVMGIAPPAPKTRMEKTTLYFLHLHLKLIPKLQSLYTWSTVFGGIHTPLQLPV